MPIEDFRIIAIVGGVVTAAYLLALWALDLEWGNDD